MLAHSYADTFGIPDPAYDALKLLLKAIASAFLRGC